MSRYSVLLRWLPGGGAGGPRCGEGWFLRLATEASDFCDHRGGWLPCDCVELLDDPLLGPASDCRFAS